MTYMHWILIALGAVLIIFDIVLATTNVLPTISETIWLWCAKHPIVPFACGVIAGHLFWQN